MKLTLQQLGHFVALTRLGKSSRIKKRYLRECGMGGRSHDLKVVGSQVVYLTNEQHFNNSLEFDKFQRIVEREAAKIEQNSRSEAIEEIIALREKCPNATWMIWNGGKPTDGIKPISWMKFDKLSDHVRENHPDKNIELTMRENQPEFVYCMKTREFLEAFAE